MTNKEKLFLGLKSTFYAILLYVVIMIFMIGIFVGGLWITGLEIEDLTRTQPIQKLEIPEIKGTKEISKPKLVPTLYQTKKEIHG